MSPSQRLSQSLEAMGLPVAPETQERLLKFLEILLRENEKINLTAIRSLEDGVTKHLVDSLAALSLPICTPEPRACVDLGSGSGMPAFALALLRPAWNFTLVESTKKKAHFLDLCAAELGLLKQVKVAPERAESLAQGRLRECADLVSCRALGRLNIVLELGLPLLKIGGYLICYKGPQPQEEIADAKRALEILGGRLSELKEFQLPLSQEGRSLIVIEKRKSSPKAYPRLPGTPSKEPLR
jgi:16S rRNA (guanine527-N7)-methyltransferase